MTLGWFKAEVQQQHYIRSRDEYIKLVVLWDMTPCVWVDRYQCFKEIYCFHLQGRNTGIHLLNCDVSSPRRPWSWYSMPWEPQIEIQREVSSSSLKALFCCCNFETSSKTILGLYQMSTLFTFYSQRGPELTLRGWGNVEWGQWGLWEEQSYL